MLVIWNACDACTGESSGALADGGPPVKGGWGPCLALCLWHGHRLL